jgi:hypothetical protein
VSAAVLGEPFFMDTVHSPPVVIAASTPGRLLEQVLYVGALTPDSTGPSSLWLPGSAGIVPEVSETVQVTVTDPAVKVASPASFAAKSSPAGVTVVDPSAADPGAGAAFCAEALAVPATISAAAAVAPLITTRNDRASGRRMFIMRVLVTARR